MPANIQSRLCLLISCDGLLAAVLVLTCYTYSATCVVIVGYVQCGQWLKEGKFTFVLTSGFIKNFQEHC